MNRGMYEDGTGVRWWICGTITEIYVRQEILCLLMHLFDLERT